MRFLKKNFPVFTGLFVFIIYLITLAPSVVEIDSGELATVQATLGIAHPTGYPLFTLAGYIFSKIPLPFTTIFQVNILAAIWCSLAVGIFTYTSKFILDNIYIISNQASKMKKVKKKKTTFPQKNVRAFTEFETIISSIAGGMVLAFSKTFWFQSTSVEVYSMQVFLFCLAILFLLKSFFSLKQEGINFLKSDWIIFAFVLALCFSNHMTSILILPGTAYLYFSKYKFNKRSIKQIIIMLFVFIPVLLLFYSYLPIRAAQSPNLNWGNPIDFERILRHISGKQYQVWLFSSTEAAKKQLVYFINELPAEFTFSILFILAGIFSAIKKSKKIGLFLLVTFITTVLYSINYDIVDIDSYFLLAYITLSFFSVFGIITILRFLKKQKFSYNISVTILVLIFAGHFYLTFGKVNQNDNYAFEDYTKAVIGSVDHNSLILSYQWDYLVSPSYYFQLVENFRKDVKVVDKELLRRSWYYHQLNTDHPDLLARMRPEVNNFLEDVKPFEREEKFNPSILETDYRAVMSDLVSTNFDRYSIYIAPEIFENEMQKGQFVLPDGYTLVPDLLLFRVVKDNKYYPAPLPDFKLRLPDKKDRYVLMIENFIGGMLTRRALYELQFDKVEKARKYVKKIKSGLPDYIIPTGLEAALGK